MLLGALALVEAELEARRGVQVEAAGEGAQVSGSGRAATAVIEPESMPPLR